MYERITIRYGDSRHRLVLSQADKGLLSLIGERLRPEDQRVLQEVFLRSFRDRARALARSVFADAVGEAIHALERDGEALTYMYSFTVKEGPLASTGSGAVSGIRVPGDDSCYYSMRAGLGICKLERLGIDGSGSGFLIEVIDCRDRTEIATANCGVITIKRRKMKLALPVLLEELYSKLVEQDCAELLLSYEESRSFPDAGGRKGSSVVG